MAKFFTLLVGLALCLAAAFPAAAQQLNNDGFQRRNGQMHILRNGQVRPMLRDARLPTGAIVTKDGFVVGTDGKRTELREGQGCDLKGNLVSMVSGGGGLALSTPTAVQRRASRATPAAEEVRVALEELRRREQGEDRDDREKYDDKHEERAQEQRKKEEEWLREERKRREEYGREREKKWKKKRKEGKKWDD